ncbi:MAG TPA: glycosyltransferase [Solirubrobacterales bacterium]|nr:glycosyltransferase [Solirubrobacterales bacterium]
MSDPRVSVVIPSSRPVRLGFALDALAEQSIGCGRFEVIVVRDIPAGRPGRAPAGLRVRWVDGDARGNIAALRNRGWRAARAPIVAFTDDDCRPSPTWLEALLDARPVGRRIVQGRTEPDPDELHLLHGLARSKTVTTLSDWYETCNIAYPRELIERLGGFDERFAAIGEDSDLGLRARESGATVDYVADAVVLHGVIPRAPWVALGEAARRDTVPLLVALHPDQRRALYGRVFWKHSHARAVLALAGVLMARRAPPLAIAAAAPYALANLDGRALARPSRLVRQVLGLLPRATVDLAEIAATLRGAARARTLVV